MNELEKSKIEPAPGGAVEAPDPSELIDLEVCFLIPSKVWFTCSLFFLHVVSVRTTRDRSEGDQYQPGDLEKKHVGFDRTRTHFDQNTDFLRTGMLHQFGLRDIRW